MRVLTFGAVVAVVMLAVPAHAQIPDTFRNLQVLPQDISRDSLVSLMRSFTFATGLRCESCHVMGANGSMQGARYDLDDKPEKLSARHMLRMVAAINDELLADLPPGERPRLKVECKTCHRGLARPHLLRTELREIIELDGVDAAVARYRELRASGMSRGAYDFGEWEINELARELARDGRIPDAIVMLLLNEEFHSASASIPVELGRLFERLGRRDDAIAAYRRALERAPQNQTARARLQALQGG